MKFTLRELIFVAVLTALPFCANFWIFKPMNLHIHTQEEETRANLKKLESCRKAMSVIEDLNEELKRHEEAVAFFESKLPAHHEIHKVLDQITQIAQQHQLDTKLFKTLPVKPFARFSEQPITMKIDGNFGAYYAFLLDVEKLPRITKIMDMQLEDEEKKGSGTTTAQFTLSIFFSHEDPKRSS